MADKGCTNLAHIYVDQPDFSREGKTVPDGWSERWLYMCNAEVQWIG